MFLLPRNRRLPVNFRYAPFATEIAQRGNMSRRADKRYGSRDLDIEIQGLRALFPYRRRVITSFEGTLYVGAAASARETRHWRPMTVRSTLTLTLLTSCPGSYSRDMLDV
jgi:hypothetical protein